MTKRKEVASTLRGGLRKLYEFLQRSTVGQVVTRATILKETGWLESSLATYLRKNKLDAFFVLQPDGRFRILKAGPALEEAEVAGALSQVTPEFLVLRNTDILKTKTETYELIREIGRGAVGHVWEARVASSGVARAVKIVNPRPDLLEPTAFNNIQERFRRESINGLKIGHQAVVKYLDHGIFRDRHFLVMELAKTSAAAMCSGGLTLSAKIAGKIIADCASALQYLHSYGLVHRDVKPSNILHCERGFVLGDLGIVKWNEFNKSFTGAGTITKASVQLGSWFYMAPEQLDEPHDVQAASDIYALGVTWYQLLTGNVRSPAAFAAQSFPAATADTRIDTCIRKMVNFDPAKRPALDEVLALAKMARA